MTGSIDEVVEVGGGSAAGTERDAMADRILSDRFLKDYLDAFFHPAVAHYQKRASGKEPCAAAQRWLIQLDNFYRCAPRDKPEAYILAKNLFRQIRDDAARHITNKLFASRSFRSCYLLSTAILSAAGLAAVPGVYYFPRAVSIYSFAGSVLLSTLSAVLYRRLGKNREAEAGIFKVVISSGIKNPDILYSILADHHVCFSQPEKDEKDEKEYRGSGN